MHALRLSPSGLEIATGHGNEACFPWADVAGSPLEAARASGLPYAPLCGGRLYLRNRVEGNQTNLELVTDFLRDRVWGGEKVVGLVRQLFYRDAFLEHGRVASSPAETSSEADAPRPALLDPTRRTPSVASGSLAIDLGQPGGVLAEGRWYPAAELPGVYLGVVQPQALPAELLASHRDRANALDSVEAGALDFLVAFDLSDFDLGFALGTDHPRVDWSDRPPDEARGRLPGPDGIATVAPLVLDGMVSPALVSRVDATFAGGFKRKHGAFKWGPFALQNHGSHYGFIEQGVVFSKLQPGLATLYVLDDGSVDMKSWTESDNALLGRIRFARQNGVPLVETDPATGEPIPGEFVGQWGPGNWSGTAEEKLRSLRSGLCLQEANGRRFLIYGYFSTATPSAMARVFQAYGCRYAMHLDMNALEHTYFALYRHRGDQIAVEHLVRGMEAVDKAVGEAIAPRFLAYPDDRDFFYLTRKGASP
jgi:hypothetical protein